MSLDPLVQDNASDSDGDYKFNSNQFFNNALGFVTPAVRRQVTLEMMKALPKAVQERITVLKNLQLQQLKLEAEYYEEIYALEKKFHEKFVPLFELRRSIVTGEKEPAKEEPKWKQVEEEIDEAFNEKFKEYRDEIHKSVKETVPEGCKGIPQFWLSLFKNTELLSEMIQEHDEPALKALNDIKITYCEENSFLLEFFFGENEFFTDKVLTKKYCMKSMVDPESPFTYEGPEIYKCTGCNINWNKGKNLTIKTIRKKQKHKERGAVRTVTKHVPNDSFFNFFNPPEVPENKDDIDEETQGILSTDYEIGHFLRSRIIPKAVLFYTGDVVDDDDDYDDEEEEEEDEEEEEEEEEESGDERPRQKRITGGGKKPTPNECPNQ